MRALILALSMLGLLVTANSAKAARRVAFVVGNGAYQKLPSLPNPPNDAKAMSSLLKTVDFEVIEAIDVTHEQLTARLLEFGKKADGADLALFYYSGQSIAVSGTNYLLPFDADIKSEMDLKLGGSVDLDTALEQTMTRADVGLVFFDASRNDPFAGSGSSPAKRVSAGQALKDGVPTSSVARTKLPRGILIEFATGPGQEALDGKKGSHSPFTQALLDNIAEPGVEIEQAMMMVRAQVSEETKKAQLPWGHSDLAGSVYLKPITSPSTPKDMK
jgi:uncharacterized caspase-like protein